MTNTMNLYGSSAMGIPLVVDSVTTIFVSDYFKSNFLYSITNCRVSNINIGSWRFKSLPIIRKLMYNDSLFWKS
jgi:hypothetical protein